jgi:hypothetical protein
MDCLSRALERFDPLNELGELPAPGGSAPASEGVVWQFIKHIRASDAYNDIVVLAGRNTVRTISPRLPPLASLLPLKQRIHLLASRLLPVVLGPAQFDLTSRGSVILLELSGSVFAREPWDERACCGYYCGVLQELATIGGANAAGSAEVRCRGADSYGRSCLLHLEL